MPSSKHTRRLRTLLLSFIIGISICAVSAWGIRELLFPPTDACAIERNEGKNLVDISQVYPIKTNIELIGHAGGKAESVFGWGATVFVKLGLELAAFDILDPSTIRRVGYFLIPGDLIYVDVNGHYAYIHSSGDSPGLWKVDIADPTQMSAVHLYKPTDHNYITSVRLWNQKAYITTQKCEYMYLFEGSIRTRCDNTLHVVDTNNPNLPTKCYQGLFGNAYRLFAISNTPELITPPRSAVQRNYRYAAAGKDGLKVYDVSNPLQSIEVGSYSSTSEFIEIVVNKTHALATSAEYEAANQSTKYALHAFDVTRSTNPIDLGELAHKPVIVAEFDHYAVLREQFANGNWPSGVEIFDMSFQDPKAASFTPVQIADVVNMTVRDKLAYATTTQNRFLILDLSNVKNPIPVASYSLGGQEQLNYGVSVVDNLAYIIVRNLGLRILDISDEMDIRNVGTYTMDSIPVELVARDHYVYIAEWYGTLEIVDVSNPAQPTQIGIYDAGDRINKMHIVNNYLFMTTGSSGLQVIDISDPHFPSLVSSFTTGTFVTGVDINCPYIYVSDIENGIFVLRSDLLLEDCD